MFSLEVGWRSLPVVLYECKTWSKAFLEESGFTVQNLRFLRLRIPTSWLSGI
jgi:hypothetical protein